MAHPKDRSGLTRRQLLKGAAGSALAVSGVGALAGCEKKYGTKVQIATYNSADEAIAKLAAGAVTFDVVIGLSGSNIVNLIAQQLLLPLNHSYLPNLEKNIWPELQDPFYDRGARYTVPYVVWSDGIGWRNDKLKEDVAAMDVPWDIFWHSQAYKGLVGLLDDRSEERRVGKAGGCRG